MTGKNNENLLNIYEDQNSDDLFTTDNDSKKEVSNETPLSFDEIDVNSLKSEKINIDDKVDNIEEIKEEKGDNINIVEDDEIDEGFINEINELKGETIKEKKSFFGNLFKKKNISNKDEGLSDKDEGLSDKDEGNIFDDFNDEGSLVDEVDKIRNEKEKDMFYYIDKASNFMQVIFIIGLLLLAITYLYIFVQNKVFEEKKDNQLLEPFCGLLLGDIPYNGTFCTSIATLNNDYKIQLDNLKSTQFDEIVNIVDSLYKIENFTKTKDVMFLKDKTNNKLKVLNILEEFDNLKYEFDRVDKDKIQCNNMVIDEKTKTVNMSCVAYSAGYESGIRGFDGKNDADSYVKGTSISIANSFLNYIEIESKTFTIINRQKIFKADSIVGEKTGFTYKTPFKLSLKYNIK